MLITLHLIWMPPCGTFFMRELVTLTVRIFSLRGRYCVVFSFFIWILGHASSVRWNSSFLGFLSYTCLWFDKFMGVAVLLLWASFRNLLSLFPCRGGCFPSLGTSSPFTTCYRLMRDVTMREFLSCRQFEYSPTWEYCVVFRFQLNNKTRVFYSLNLVFHGSFLGTLLLLDKTMGCGC